MQDTMRLYRSLFGTRAYLRSICEGAAADRPRPASSGLRSSVAGLASPERGRANPSAISRTLNPIAHKGASFDDVAPAVSDR